MVKFLHGMDATPSTRSIEWERPIADPLVINTFCVSNEFMAGGMILKLLLAST
jgi:hypothetical protein